MTFLFFKILYILLLFKKQWSINQRNLMNLFNIIFLFLIGLQHVYCGDGLNWNRLPCEINVLITNFTQPLFNELPVIKFNNVINNDNYNELSMHFPSTVSFEFIEIKKEHERALQEKGLIYQPDPKSVSRNSLVLPSIQLGLRDTSIWINNYELQIFLKKL